MGARTESAAAGSTKVDPFERARRVATREYLGAKFRDRDTLRAIAWALIGIGEAYARHVDLLEGQASFSSPGEEPTREEKIQ